MGPVVPEFERGVEFVGLVDFFDCAFDFPEAGEGEEWLVIG